MCQGLAEGRVDAQVVERHEISIHSRTERVRGANRKYRPEEKTRKEWDRVLTQEAFASARPS